MSRKTRKHDTRETRSGGHGLVLHEFVTMRRQKGPPGSSSSLKTSDTRYLDRSNMLGELAVSRDRVDYLEPLYLELIHCLLQHGVWSGVGILRTSEWKIV